MRIENNTAAFNVWTNYTDNLANLSSSYKKLSSGQIGIADDPAGVGIGERMRSQISALDAVRQNIQNAASGLQTKDAYAQTMGDLLSRMKSLAVAAKGGVSATDKANMETEFNSLQDEIARISSNYTAAGKYDGLYLFRGGNGVPTKTGDGVEPGAMEVQTGADSGQKTQLKSDDLSVQNSEVIGTVDTYTYDASHNLVGSLHTPVTWGEVIDSENGISVTSEEAVGAIDKAIDYVSAARAGGASDLESLESSFESVLSYEADLISAEGAISSVDSAKESIGMMKSLILSKAGLAMEGQANSIPQYLLLALLKG